MQSTDNPVLDGIRAALADLPTLPPPRHLDVFLSRGELARAASVPTGKVFRAFTNGALTPDAIDSHGAPLFLMMRLPLLKAVLEKANHETTL